MKLNRKDLLEVMKNRKERVSKTSKLQPRKFKKMPVKTFTKEEIAEINKKRA